MAEVCSLEVYEVEIEELDDAMFWPELDGSVPEKRLSNNTAVSSTLSSCLKNIPSLEFVDLHKIQKSSLSVCQ